MSLDEQERRIFGRTVEEGWQLTEVFIERNIRGAMPLGERPQGARLLRILEPGDVLIAARLDRVFRNARDALNVISDLHHRSIVLWLLDMGGDVSSPVAKFAITVLAATAEFESDLVRENVGAARATLRHRGQQIGGSKPFGYRLGEAIGHGQARQLIPDPVEQAAITDMKAMRANGVSLMDIRDYLRAKGFKISHEGIRGILNRTGPG
jgi:DNA invertase Pin-like site-specific DNA recombinase